MKSAMRMAHPIFLIWTKIMKLIIPMAGRGKRLRPQSNVTPKPLLSVAGKTMVERIVEGFAGILPRPVMEAIFVLGPSFGSEAPLLLEAICDRQQIKAHTVIQHEPLGTAHAVAVAKDHLRGEGIVVYADTVFVMNNPVSLDGADVIAWVKEVDDPSRFGVAVREGDRITAFVEKPNELISREALIGIYYVRSLERLSTAIDHLFEENIKGPSGEYFLTDAFDVLLKQQQVFKTASVSEWLDCGTLQALFDTSCRLLELEGSTALQHDNSVLVEPVFIGPDVRLEHAVVGPNVCIEKGATVVQSVVRNSILFEGANVCCTSLSDSFVGAHATVCCQAGSVNIGDHSVLS